jgi:hypothetical protein
VTPPTVAFGSPIDGDTLTSKTVTITGTAWDDVGVQKVQLSTDALNWIDASGTTSWSATLTLGEGQNTIYARATDASGNLGTRSIAVTVRTPATGPEVAPPLDLAIVGLISGVVASAVAVLVALILVKRRRQRGPVR